MENKETLEEVCDGVLNYLIPDCKKEMSIVQYSNAMYALRFIADWQAERMYSEEDMRKAFSYYSQRLILGYEYIDVYFKEWMIEQFKKK
jgi:hypothetical protein